MKPLKLFVPLSKIDEEQRMVFGYASTEALDSQGEVIKRDAIEAALPDYMKFANIREMHQPSAVGVAESADMDANGLYLAVKVVDESAWAKVKAKVYKGFSVGGFVTGRDKAAKNIITGIKLSEISLVDRPANPEALFDVFKADAAELAKSLYDIGSLADCLSSLTSVQSWLASERDWEGDNSKIPDRLKTVMREVGEILKDLAVEEVDEAVNADIFAASEKLGDLAKAGARNSKKDLERLTTIHDNAVAMGATCGSEKAAKGETAMTPEELKKVTADVADATKKALEGALGPVTATQKVHGDLLATQSELLTKQTAAIVAQGDTIKSHGEQLETLKKQVDGFGAQLTPPKAVATVTKDADAGATQPAAKVDEKDPVAMMKAAQSRPIMIDPTARAA